jgi:hypothetical protein
LLRTPFLSSAAAACTRTPTPVFKYKLLRRLEEVAAAAKSQKLTFNSMPKYFSEGQKWKGNEAE